MDRELNVAEGWQTAWLDRTYHPLRCYLSMTSCVLTFAILALGLAAFFTIRGSERRLRNASADRAYIIARMHKRILKFTRGHLIIGCIYLVHALALTVTDAGISIRLLKEDVNNEPEKWTSALYTEASLYAIYLFVIFMASFLLVPMIQLVAVTCLLSRFGRKHGSTSLSDYIPEARFCSTHIAQLWSMASFILTAFCPPTHEDSFWRYILLQACIGSALTWSQASFAFIYCADQLANQEIEFGGNGLNGILRMFGKTVQVVVTTYRSEKEELPKYVEVAQEDSV